MTMGVGGGFGRRGAHTRKLLILTSLAMATTAAAQQPATSVPGSAIYSAPPIPKEGYRYDLRDRLDILNLLATYGQLFDGGYRREWIDTEFADNIVWTITLPPEAASPPIVMKGRQEIERFFAGSDAKVASSTSNARLVHVIANMAVLDQSACEAHVAAYEIVGNSLAGREPGFQFHTTARIEGWLTKEGGRWRISKWNVFPDTTSARLEKSTPAPK